MSQFLNRRRFLVQSGILSTHCSLLASTALSLAGSLALADTPIMSEPLATLQTAEVAGLQAIAARILPEDESGPGAISGGVIHFMDQVLGSSRQEWLAPLREGLQTLDAKASSTYAASHFVALNAEQQDALLRDIETTDFFVTVRTLTIAGMFALPEYGGNRGHAGYQLIGFGHQHVWQPPFGYYDADYMARGE